jgi:antitoxin (DNA-binding transcriptional repressor) of toxin-antitoxin stability system
MAVLHMTEAEVARNLHAVLEKVRRGIDVVIEQNSLPVAVIKSAPAKGRKISEVIAGMETMGADAAFDEAFARDVEEGIKAHREPWKPPS